MTGYAAEPGRRVGVPRLDEGETWLVLHGISPQLHPGCQVGEVI